MTPLRTAWAAGTVPILVGTAIFIMWLIFRTNELMFAGVVTIYAGLCSVFFGVICLAIHLRRNWLSSEVPGHRLAWQAIAVIGLFLANFVAAGCFVFGAALIETRYHLSITNQSNETLQAAHVEGGGVSILFGDIVPGQTVKRAFWIDGEGELVLTATLGERKVVAVVDGYVTDCMGNDAKVTVEASGEVLTQDRWSGFALCPHPSSDSTPQEMFRKGDITDY